MLFFWVVFGKELYSYVKRNRESIKYDQGTGRSARKPVAKKNRVAVTAHWVHRGASIWPKKDAGVGYVGMRIWVHNTGASRK